MYVIAGPTASGKTAVAIALAKKIDGEVISADSMQVYKHMDIGTAKPTSEEMDGIPHHLIDVVTPDTPFSAATYQQLATRVIEDIISRGKTPILAGGTGFYINAVLYDTEFSSVDQDLDMEHRKKFADIATEKGVVFLHGLLAEADPEAALAIHPNNVKRVARALSFCETTGGLFSAHNKTQKARQPRYDTHFAVLTMNREVLYDRINRRTDIMLETGFIDEVRALLSKGYHEGLAAMQGIGYKEITKLLNGECSRDEAIESMKQSTRNYAKRQITWFTHNAANSHKHETDGKTLENLADDIIIKRGKPWRKTIKTCF